jgi:hypothetical protein
LPLREKGLLLGVHSVGGKREQRGPRGRFNSLMTGGKKRLNENLSWGISEKRLNYK